jgi:hypothetical protein
LKFSLPLSFIELKIQGVMTQRAFKFQFGNLHINVVSDIG